ITGVPAGTWFLLGHSVPGHACEALTEDQAVHVGSLGPLEIRRDAPVSPTAFRLREMRVLDPPILVALQRVRSKAFETDIVRAAG
ncbi:AraC family transcriptional regulator, partial [Streptomyces sp. SID4945]|nr:AraC family transcriptional regulator [Streptomyces sp. SID4945]